MDDASIGEPMRQLRADLVAGWSAFLGVLTLRLFPSYPPGRRAELMLRAAAEGAARWQRDPAAPARRPRTWQGARGVHALKAICADGRDGVSEALLQSVAQIVHQRLRDLASEPAEHPVAAACGLVLQIDALRAGLERSFSDTYPRATLRTVFGQMIEECRDGLDRGAP